MSIGDNFTVQDEQGTWHDCVVVWTGGRTSPLLCPWGVAWASSLHGNSSQQPAGGVGTQSRSRPTSLTSQTAMRA